MKKHIFKIGKSFSKYLSCLNKIVSFSSFIYIVLIIDAVLTIFYISVRFNWIPIPLWIIIYSLAIIVFAFYFVIYLKPHKNFFNKGINYLDVSLLSIAVSFAIFSIICIPNFHIIHDGDVCSCFDYLGFALFSMALIIVRVVILNKADGQDTIGFHFADFLKNNFPDDKADCFLIDESVEYDLLDRSDLIDRIKLALISNKSNKKNVVGIVGPWGSGKTTYVKNALRKIKEDKSLCDKYIIPDKFFSVWSFEDARSVLVTMILDIYELLDIGIDGVSIRRSIEKYANAFLEDSKVSGFVNIFSNYSLSKDSVIATINDYLVRNDKRLFFVIDDIDRATSENVLFVYKAICQMVGINKITFVCLYDEAQLDKTLESDINHTLYLEKIVNIRILIPPVNVELYQKLGYMVVNNYLNKYYPDIIQRTEKRDEDIIKNSLKLIKSFRGMIILLNNFFNCLSIDNILNPYDLFAIELLKMQDSTICDFLINNRYSFITGNTTKSLELFDTIFDNEHAYRKYKEVILSIFPLFDKNYSRDINFTKLCFVKKRICSKDYFMSYLSDNTKEGLDLIDLFAEIKETKEESSLYNKLDVLFDNHRGMYVNIVFIINSLMLIENDVNIMKYLFNYFINRYYYLISNEMDNRLEINIISLLKLLTEEIGSNFLDYYVTNYVKTSHKIIILYKIYLRLDKNTDKNINQITLLFDQLFKSYVLKINNTFLYTEKYYVTGITSFLNNYMNRVDLKHYIEKSIDVSTIFALIKDFGVVVYESVVSSQCFEIQYNELYKICDKNIIEDCLNRAKLDNEQMAFLKDAYYKSINEKHLKISDEMIFMLKDINGSYNKKTRIKKINH